VKREKRLYALKKKRMTQSLASQLRTLLAKPGAILVPGASDALSAKLIEQAGFPAIYISGAAVSATILAAPDIGLISFGEVLQQVQRIAAAVTIPLIVDADTGYGNAINTMRTVQELERCGVAAIQLEDQVMPKKCGHLNGKEVIEADEMAQKIRAACAARANPDTVIIARTDARATHDFDEALRRCWLYREAGADVIFFEALHGHEEVERLPQELDAPLLLNMGGGGLTPMRPLAELAELGYKVVIYPGDLQKAAIKAMQRVLDALKAEGHSAHIADAMVGFKERFELLGMSKYEDLEKRFA
jgi:carboxyvinyl-carboxyphosphonate phosphorylmutase